MLQVVLVDDETAARRALREHCEREADLRVIGEYSDGLSALQAVRIDPPHVIFLDVEMESMDGMALARSLEQRCAPLIVFVTAHERYAIEAFALSAVDYLLKPFDRERFRCTLDRVRRRLLAETSVQREEALEAALERIEAIRRGLVDLRPRILVGLGSTLQMLDVGLIELAWADRNYVKLRVGEQIYCLRGTLVQAEKALQSQPLLRISRSCLVNLNYVRKVSRTPRGDFILVIEAGVTLASAEGFRESVRRQLERFRVSPE